MADETEGQEGEAEQQQPPLVKLTGEAGFEPKFPVVGTEIEYYWSETNFGGKHPDVYHARVVFKKDDEVHRRHQRRVRRARRRTRAPSARRSCRRPASGASATRSSVGRHRQQPVLARRRTTPTTPSTPARTDRKRHSPSRG